MVRHVAFALTFFAVASCLLAVSCPDWAARAGLDVWNVPALEKNIFDAEERMALLNRQDAVIRERMAAKEQVIQELIAERLTLLEAAAWFRRLNVETPDFPGLPPTLFPGRTENERYCRQVLRFVRIACERMAASQAEIVHCRLEAELEMHLTMHEGEVELPTVY